MNSATATATASVVSSARGYVPPHARDDGYSDSDASDAETSARERSYGDRFGSSRVRANAASCVASLARADPRSVHSSWPALLPTSAAHYVRSAVTRRRGSSRVPFTLARVVLHDPSPRARAAAAAAVAQLLDSAASRQYLSAAETKLDAKTGLAARRVNFASLSSALGDLAVATHGALTLAVAAEPAMACVPSVCKASAALADAAPFARLPRGEPISGRRARGVAQGIQPRFGHDIRRGFRDRDRGRRAALRAGSDARRGGGAGAFPGRARSGSRSGNGASRTFFFRG